MGGERQGAADGGCWRAEQKVSGTGGGREGERKREGAGQRSASPPHLRTAAAFPAASASTSYRAAPALSEPLRTDRAADSVPQHCAVPRMRRGTNTGEEEGEYGSFLSLVGLVSGGFRKC